MKSRVSLWTLFAIFLKIGSTAFGGFMALIAVVQKEAVERRRWLKQDDMLNGVSLATILPGPVAVNVVAYVGHRLRGGPGAFVAAVGVILPSFLLILGLSAAYFYWGSLPTVSRLFQGFVPAVTAIIVSAAWTMGRKSIKGWREALLLAMACGLLLGIGGFWTTLAIVVGAGVIGAAFFRKPPSLPQPANKRRGPKAAKRSRLNSLGLLPFVGAAPFLGFNAALTLKIFSTFAGVSLFLFGGGYVFIPFIREVVVETHHWLTPQEFVDGIALGQVTPGPILITATFIGYKVAGLAGSIAATVGIFLPPALLMIIATHALDRIRHHPVIVAALAGIRPAVVGMIAAAAVTVGLSAPVHWVSLAIFAAALLALVRFRLEVVWIIPAAGLAGLLLY
ncbi:MAG: chromate efflux transporter [Gammaproteobacteria bacterium]|nr:chromate efflux transporter [Gammaproteobacteria bacterium]